MQTSPWMANNQGAYEVSGLAALLLQRNRDNQEAFQNIGQFAGALGAGAIGAGQGARDPSVFGDGTTPTSGAAQAGLMNFANAYSGNSGGGGGGFSRLVNNGGGGGDPETNFKKFETLGKMADNTRSMLSDPNSRLKDAKVMGYTDDEWKHLGTAGKISAFQATKQAMDQKTALQGYDAGQLHMAQVQQQMKQQADDSEAWDRFGAGYNRQTQPIPATAPGAIGDPARPLQSPMVNLAAQSLANPAPLNGPEMLKLAMQSGVRPADALAVARSAQLVDQGQKELNGKGTNQLGFQEDPVSGVRFATYGNVLQPSGVNPDKSRPSTTLVDDGQGGQIPVLVNPKTGSGTQLRTGELNDADRFKALHADKIALMAERTKVAWNKDLKAQYDTAIAGVDEQLKQFSKDAAKSSGGAPPKAGDLVKGYKFKGGNPADKNNWEKQ